MLENTLQKQKPVGRVKCIKCGKKEATKEDQMCDSCRYLLTIEGIIKNRNE